MANERTALGWQRSSLTLAVIAAVLLGHAVHEREPGGVFAAAAVGAGAAWVGRLGRRLYRRRAVSVQEPAAGPLRTITLVTLLAAAIAAALVVMGSPA
jgi:uncharacterized membrane protein YidH (DUF202 family)